jgi:formylglycine-generating enzyme required for sulfatase activity
VSQPAAPEDPAPITPPVPEPSSLGKWLIPSAVIAGLFVLLLLGFAAYWGRNPELLTTEVGKIQLKLIPAGRFSMGSPDGEGEKNEHPRHNVQISRPFYLGVCEVTQAQYKAVMNQYPSHYSHTVIGKGVVAGKATDRRPVENVSWFDAVRFCNKLSELEGLPRDQWCYEPNPAGEYAPGMTIPANFLERTGYRLPTEAEWEYACRAGKTLKYCCGNDETELPKYAWFGKSLEEGTRIVGQGLPNAWGLYDMHGNVWEWCSDWYDEKYYEQMLKSQMSNINPTGPSEEKPYHVLRGGSFNLFPASLRSAVRIMNPPAAHNWYIGLRLAKTSR